MNDNRITRRNVLKNIGTAGTTGLLITATASAPSAAQQGGGMHYATRPASLRASSCHPRRRAAIGCRVWNPKLIEIRPAVR